MRISTKKTDRNSLVNCKILEAKCVCVHNYAYMYIYIYFYVYTTSIHYFSFAIMQNHHFAPSALFVLFKTLILFWSRFMFVFKDFL